MEFCRIRADLQRGASALMSSQPFAAVADETTGHYWPLGSTSIQEAINDVIHGDEYGLESRGRQLEAG